MFLMKQQKWDKSIILWNHPKGDCEPESFALQSPTKKVSCSNDLALFVTTKNEVYPLPIFDESANAPKLMKPLIKDKVVDGVVLGGAFYVVVTLKKGYRISRDGKNIEELGFEKPDDTKFELAKKAKNALGVKPESIVQSNFSAVYSGEHFIIFQLEDGTFYGLGDNSHAQLCLKPTVLKMTKTPVPLQINLKQKIRYFAAGRNHCCLVVEDNGSLFCWGDNSNSQCGYDSKRMQVLTRPTRVKTAADSYEGFETCSAWGASVFLRNDGSVLLFYKSGKTVLNFPEPLTWCGTGIKGIVYGFNQASGNLFYFEPKFDNPNGHPESVIEYIKFDTDSWDLDSVSVSEDGSGIVAVGKHNKGLTMKKPEKVSKVEPNAETVSKQDLETKKFDGKPMVPEIEPAARQPELEEKKKSVDNVTPKQPGTTVEHKQKNVASSSLIEMIPSGDLLSRGSSPGSPLAEETEDSMDAFVQESQIRKQSLQNSNNLLSQADGNQTVKPPEVQPIVKIETEKIETEKIDIAAESKRSPLASMASKIVKMNPLTVAFSPHKRHGSPERQQNDGGAVEGKLNPSSNLNQSRNVVNQNQTLNPNGEHKNQTIDPNQTGQHTNQTGQNLAQGVDDIIHGVLINPTPTEADTEDSFDFRGTNINNRNNSNNIPLTVHNTYSPDKESDSCDAQRSSKSPTSFVASGKSKVVEKIKNTKNKIQSFLPIPKSFNSPKNINKNQTIPSSDLDGVRYGSPSRSDKNSSVDYNGYFSESPAMEVKSQEDIALLENSITTFTAQLKSAQAAILTERMCVRNLLTTVAAQRQVTLSDLQNRNWDYNARSDLEKCERKIDELADFRASYFEAVENVLL